VAYRFSDMAIREIEIGTDFKEQNDVWENAKSSPDLQNNQIRATIEKAAILIDTKDSDDLKCIDFQKGAILTYENKKISYDDKFEITAGPNVGERGFHPSDLLLT